MALFLNRISTLLMLLMASLLLVSSGQLAAQEPYELDWKREVPIVAAGTFMELSFFILHRKMQPLSVEQIEALDPLKVPSFDRYSLRHYKPKAAKFSDVLLYTAPLVPLSLFADKTVRDDAGTMLALYGETMLINSGLTAITKQLTMRTRPFVYNDGAPFEKKQQLDSRMSFFSGHTSTAACSWFLTAKNYHDYNPGSDFRPVVWTTSAAVPALMAYLRCRAGKHFLSDVVVGYLVGAAVGILIPEIHRVNN